MTWADKPDTLPPLQSVTIYRCGKSFLYLNSHDTRSLSEAYCRTAQRIGIAQISGVTLTIALLRLYPLHFRLCFDDALLMLDCALPVLCLVLIVH